MAFDRTKPYCARNGQTAEIVYTLKDGRLVVVYGDGEHCLILPHDGRLYYRNVSDGLDLVNIPEKRVVVINHYPDGVDSVHTSQENADLAALPSRLGCTVLEYERPVYGK